MFAVLSDPLSLLYGAFAICLAISAQVLAHQMRSGQPNVGPTKIQPEVATKPTSLQSGSR